MNKSWDSVLTGVESDDESANDQQFVGFGRLTESETNSRHDDEDVVVQKSALFADSVSHENGDESTEHASHTEDRDDEREDEVNLLRVRLFTVSVSVRFVDELLDQRLRSIRDSDAVSMLESRTDGTRDHGKHQVTSHSLSSTASQAGIQNMALLTDEGMA